MKLFLLGWMLVSPLSATGSGEAASKPAAGGIESIKPAWRVGDTWRIETTTPRLAVASAAGDSVLTSLRWEFHVEGIEVVHQRACFRVSIRCLTNAGHKPRVVFWADRASYALVQVRAEIPAREGYVTVSESYQFLGNQPTPVIGPFSALPIDLPCFCEGSNKGVDDFYYEALPGPAGHKAVGDVGFLFRIHQSVRTGNAVSADAGEFAKSVDGTSLTEVRLKNHAVHVRQFWQAGLPWPAISTNGRTTARLLRADDSGTDGAGDSTRQPSRRAN